MSHPLIQPLNTLAGLLGADPALASSTEAVKVLDKVSAAVKAAVALLENAAVGKSPEAMALTDLLKRALAKPDDAREVKKLLTKLLAGGKLPPTKKGSSAEESLAGHFVKQAKAPSAIAAVQKYLNRPIFDTSSSEKYDLLKQIRKLGQMDEQQKKAATKHLLSKPALARELCAAANIPTTNKKGISIETTKLVKSLIAHGERYAENTGE